MLFQCTQAMLHNAYNDFFYVVRIQYNLSINIMYLTIATHQRLYSIYRAKIGSALVRCSLNSLMCFCRDTTRVYIMQKSCTTSFGSTPKSSLEYWNNNDDIQKTWSLPHIAMPRYIYLKIFCQKQANRSCSLISFRPSDIYIYISVI